MKRTRLRDFIITKEDWIFAVTDYCHEEGIRSMLRYIPNAKGERGRHRKYHKLSFDSAFELMREKHPAWVKDVHVVPWNAVKEILSPNNELHNIMKRNSRVKKIVNVLQKEIPLRKMGVTGSLLVGLETETSDIDFVVYGKAWFRAREIIAKAKKKNIIGEISEEMWHEIYKKRKPELSFEEFLIHEIRKGNRGMVEDTYFDLLYVRDWEEITPCMHGRDTGIKTIEAIVTNADFAFDSPAVFKVDHPEISYVLSYTHTYAGQAFPGERIEARGMVEVLNNNMKRLVVGTSREAKGEWIRSLTLLEKS